MALEPYIFQSNYNLLQSPTFRNGAPIAYNQVNYSARGQVAEMLAKVILEDTHLPEQYRKQMMNLLQQMGDLNTTNNRFAGSTRVGYSHLPGGWRDAPVVYPPVPLQETLDSQFVGGGNPETSPGSYLYNADNIDWQNSLMQPIGGMDRVWQRLLVQAIPAGSLRIRSGDPRTRVLQARDGRGRGVRRYVGDLVLLNHRVTGIHEDPGGKAIRIDFAASDPATGKTVTGSEMADFCFSSMAPNLLAKTPTSLSPEFNKWLAAVDQTPAIKVGWQGRNRFWERENNIYGGISWTTNIIGQIWYPSEDFNASTGVLTGAYNRGEGATEFGKFTQKKRIEEALKGGALLHKDFAAKVYADKGLTIAWHYMPFQVGGWASDTAYTQPDVYQQITDLPQGRLYLAGDAWSYLPGWQEGGITSVYQAIEALAKVHG